MGWVRRARVVLLMARVAQGAIQRVIVIDVAIGTEPRRYGVRAGQRETRRSVVECAVHPIHGVVTIRAGGRERSRHVIHGCGRVVVIGLMATDTSSRQRSVIAVGMAVGALS